MQAKTLGEVSGATPDIVHMNMRYLSIAIVVLLCFFSGRLDAADAGQADKDNELLSSMRQSAVIVSAWSQHQLLSTGTGFIVRSGDSDAYVVTSVSAITKNARVTVRSLGRRTELAADVIKTDPSLDFALLRVPGLGGSALTFSLTPAGVGDIVWSVARWPDNDSLVVSKGNVLNSYQVSGQGPSVVNHSATVGHSGGGHIGSVLLNECGEVTGLNMASPGADRSQSALGGSAVRGLLAAQNVPSNVAVTRCLSDVGQAREVAEQATLEARRASEEAVRAQRVAQEFEARLQASNRRNESLEAEARSARQRADEAIRAAALAQKNADDNRLELERQTASIKAETEAMLKLMERDREMQEQRFQDVLREQRAEAAMNMRFFVIAAVAVVVAILIGAVLIRFRSGGTGGSTALGSSGVALRPVGSNLTEMHKQELVEYVLDGRDEDGIRYLLRISGDQMTNPEGVIIGRNPQDSPYIINHGDVSRKHARMKVMKNRVFIEDLGSTNGTSVNGQSIDDKGPVTVANGDQIIIGSVVMKLRVLGS